VQPLRNPPLFIVQREGLAPFASARPSVTLSRQQSIAAALQFAKKAAFSESSPTFFFLSLCDHRVDDPQRRVELRSDLLEKKLCVAALLWNWVKAH
jgi:hypothetical protein